jgi:hypothetical protein
VAGLGWFPGRIGGGAQIPPTVCDIGAALDIGCFRAHDHRFREPFCCGRPAVRTRFVTLGGTTAL